MQSLHSTYFSVSIMQIAVSISHRLSTETFPVKVINFPEIGICLLDCSNGFLSKFYHGRKVLQCSGQCITTSAVHGGNELVQVL